EHIGSEQERRSVSPAHIDNVRAALEWCFGANGDLVVGVRLAAVATPVFLAMSLFSECRHWSERAILALDCGTVDGREEMRLQACLGVSLMQMVGQTDAALAALNRALAIAQAHGDAFSQIGLLGMLSMFHV